MAGFEIAPDKVKKSAGEWNQCSNQLKGYAGRVEDIANSVCQLGDSAGCVKSALMSILAELRKNQKGASELSIKLKEIAVLYDNAEKGICNSVKTRAVMQKPSGEGSSALDELGNAGDEGGGVGDYFLDALKQALLGDFSEDSNFLGTSLSVLIGFVPFVGQIADIRDLVADIIHLVDGGPTAEEWVALGFTLVGLVPGLGDILKHGDEAADAVKGLLKNADHADEAADVVKTLFQKGDDVYSAVGSKIDEFNDFFRHHVVDQVDELIDSHPWSSNIKKEINHLTDAVKDSEIYQDVSKFLDDLSYTNGQLEISAKKVVKGIVDEYEEEFAQSAITKLLTDVLGGSEKERLDT